MTIPPQCSPRVDTSSHPHSLTLCFPWPPKAANTLRRPLLRGLRGVGLGVLHRCGCGVTSRIWLISRRPLLAVAGVLTAWAPANTTRAFPESDAWANETNGACPSVAALTTSLRIRASSLGLRDSKIKPRQSPKGQNSGSAGPLAAQAG